MIATLGVRAGAGRAVSWPQWGRTRGAEEARSGVAPRIEHCFNGAACAVRKAPAAGAGRQGAATRTRRGSARRRTCSGGGSPCALDDRRSCQNRSVARGPAAAAATVAARDSRLFVVACPLAIKGPRTTSLLYLKCTISSKNLNYLHLWPLCWPPIKYHAADTTRTGRRRAEP